jgi:hypothetical protein
MADTLESRYRWSSISKCILISSVVLLSSLFECRAHAYYNLGGFWQSTTPYKLVFSSSPQAINTWACTPVVIERIDRASRPSNWGTPTVVNLSGTDVTYYSDSSCDTVITTATIAAGTNSITVYFNYSTNGSLSAAAAATGLISTSQTETVSIDPYTWIGGPSCVPANQSTAACWQGGSIPGAANRAIFDGNCTTNCSVTLNSNASIGGIAIENGYGSNAINQGAFTITLNGGTFPGHTFYQNDGNFNGGSAAMTVKGDFKLLNGTFTATTNTLAVADGFNIAGGTIVPGTGTMQFGIGVFAIDVASTITPGTANYNNIIFDRSHGTTTVSGTWTVLGTLQIDNASNQVINGGTINVSGNVTVTAGGGGTATVNFVNNTTGQTVTGTSGAYLPNVGINAPGGVTIANGTTLGFTSNWTWTAGTVTTTGTTVLLLMTSTSTFSDSNTQFNNFTFTSNGGFTYTISGTMNINGNMVLDTSANTILQAGTIDVGGNITATLGGGGTATLQLNGSAPQTITGVAAGILPGIEINNPNGVTLSGTIGVGANWTWVSGTVTATGTTVSFNGVGTITDANTQFNNVTFAANNNTIVIAAGNILHVNGTLLFNQNNAKVGSGDIWALGPVSMTKNSGGAALIHIVGTSAQTITGVAGQPFTAFIINNPNGVTLSGTVVVNQNWTWTAGTVTTTGATVQFGTTSTSATISDSNTLFGDVVFSKVGSNSTTITGTLNVGGNLTLSLPSTLNTLLGGTIAVAGNMTMNGCTGGTTAFTFNGSGAQTFTANGGTLPGGTITVAKTGGSTLTLATAMSANTAGQNLTISTGQMNMAGFPLTVNNVCTINAGATLTENGGILTDGSLVNNGTLNP